MLSRSSGSRCSRAARPCAIGMGRSSRLRHFRRERTRRRLEGCSQIGGGSVRVSHFPSLTSLRCVCWFCFWKVTPELSHKRHWITSARACRPSNTILTRSFCGATSFQCSSLTMPRILTCERSVTSSSLFSNPSRHLSDQRKCSALISSKRSHSQILSVPRPCENAHASMLARSRNSVS